VRKLRKRTEKKTEDILEDQFGFRKGTSNAVR
jgi:hypothetical protein